MSDDPSITDLVTCAAHGDEQAWNALVERYAPLVWSICRRYRLSDADTHEAQPERLAGPREPPGQTP